MANNFFSIEKASSYIENDAYYVNAKLKMDFTEEVKEALMNGVPLVLVIELNVFQKNKWWDNIIKASIQRFELRYHALTNLYQIKNQTTDQKFTFSTQEDALELLGNIHHAHLVTASSLKKEAHHNIQLRVFLDIWSLPEVLRPIASLSPNWHLNSQWYFWELN